MRLRRSSAGEFLRVARNNIGGLLQQDDVCNYSKVPGLGGLPHEGTTLGS